MASHTRLGRHGRVGSDGAGDAFFREHGWTRVPRLVQWMVTLRCPLACPHCLAAGGSAPLEMPMPQARGLIEQVAELGVSEFLLTGGEPLVRQDLPDIIHVLQANEVQWSLNTAIAPDRRLRRAIEQWPPRFVAVSLDGPPEVHDSFRGRAGSFGQAMESIAYFAQLAADGVAAGTTVTTRNFPYLRETFGIVLESGATCWGLHLLVPEGRAAERKDLVPSRRQLKELLRFAAAKRNHFPVTMADEIGYCGTWEPMVRDEPFFCGAGKAQCVVLPDGEVVPCNTLDRTTSAGNVNEKTLREIWENGFEQLRAWSPRGKCASCEYAAACEGGCWLQRRHGTQCFRDVWRMPRMAKTAAAAICLGLAASGLLSGQTALAAREAPIPPGDQRAADARKMEILQSHIVQWYAAGLGGPRAPRFEEVKQSLKKALPDDPGASYFLAFTEGERPADLAELAGQVEEAFKTEQRSLCLIGLIWRDVTEWCLDGKPAAERTPEERKVLRDLMTSVSLTAEEWRKEIFREKLDPFLRRPRDYRHFLQTKGGWRIPPPSELAPGNLGAKRGWTNPNITEAFLEEHPYAEVMTLSYEAGDDSGLRCLRSGEEVPADGKLGVFDILIVPGRDDEAPVNMRITVLVPERQARTPEGRRPQPSRPGATTTTTYELGVVLPSGTEMAYGDVLRLTYEQNREAVDEMSRKVLAHPPAITASRPATPWQAFPIVLPALREMRRKLEDDGKAASEDMARVMWRLTDLYLF